MPGRGRPRRGEERRTTKEGCGGEQGWSEQRLVIASEKDLGSEPAAGGSRLWRAGAWVRAAASMYNEGGANTFDKILSFGTRFACVTTPIHCVRSQHPPETCRRGSGLARGATVCTRVHVLCLAASPPSVDLVGCVARPAASEGGPGRPRPRRSGRGRPRRGAPDADPPPRTCTPPGRAGGALPPPVVATRRRLTTAARACPPRERRLPLRRARSTARRGSSTSASSAGAAATGWAWGDWRTADRSSTRRA